MNSGTYFTVVSPDKNTLAVLAETPYEKEQPAKFKVALFNPDMNQTFEGQFSLPGEN